MTGLHVYSFIFVTEYQTHEKQICLDFQNVSHTCLFFTAGLSTTTPFMEWFSVVRLYEQKCKLGPKFLKN